MSIEFRRLPIRIPDLLLPRKDIDLYTWSVLACDQFTSDRSYWEKAESIVGANPSTLRLILPEYKIAQKSEAELDVEFQSIREHSETYLSQGVFQEHKNTLLFTERKTKQHDRRCGLMLQVDLAAYSVDPTEEQSVKASEAIVHERLPKRIVARKHTTLDIPHILLVYSDPQEQLMRDLQTSIETTQYQTDLMLGGGSIRASTCNTKTAVNIIENFFTPQIDKNPSALFIIGDGNHSLMSAKRIWEERGRRMDDPERWALVEMLNIFDKGLHVEPIHRVLFQAKNSEFLEKLAEQGTLLQSDSNSPDPDATHILSENKNYYWKNYDSEFSALETFESILEKSPELYEHVDFIHSSKAVHTLTQSPGTLGAIFPPMKRDSIFSTVQSKKLFPRKAFSIGEAEEKRYYIESCLRT